MGSDVGQMDIKDAFLLLAEYKQDYEEGTEEEEGIYEDLPEIYNKARYGIEIEFDLYDYVYDMMVISKIKAGKIQYRNKILDMSDFWTEIEERNNLIKKWLRENTEDKKLATGYGMKK